MSVWCNSGERVFLEIFLLCIKCALGYAFMVEIRQAVKPVNYSFK